MSVLDGNELEKKIGEVGTAIIDINNELKLVASIKVEVDLLAELKKLAAKSATPVDDAAVLWIEKVLGAAKALA